MCHEKNKPTNLQPARTITPEPLEIHRSGGPLVHESADKYVGTIFRDAQEAALVDVAVLRVLKILHQVGADAPGSPLARR